jgi:alcohol dehydrogenase
MLKLRLPLPVFRNAKEIVNGRNARMALRGLVANKVVLITSGSFEQSVHYAQVKRLIKCEALLVVKKSWGGEPSLDGLQPTLKQVEDFKPDAIVALGGGSVIDGAKLVWLLYEAPQLTNEQLFRPLGLPPLRGRSRFAAIPTTIGAGSEVSSAAVMFDKQTGSKKAIVTHDFLPDLVLLDPELVMDVPTSVLFTTLGDALSHAVEGYVSKITHPLMDTFAEKAVAIIAMHWQELYKPEPDLDVISELQHAAMMAGWVQNHCLVGMSHAIAHQLSGYGINHGIANAVLMPQVIQFNSQNDNTRSRYDKLAHNAGLVGGTAELINLFTQLVNTSDQQNVFQTTFNFDNIAEHALLDPAAKSNPVVFTADDVKKVLIACL